MRYLSCAIGSIHLAALAWGLATSLEGAVAAQTNPSDLNTRLNVSQHQLQRIDVVSDDASNVQFSVSLDGRSVTVNAAVHSMRSADYKLMARGEGGKLTPMTPGPVTTYRGNVPETGGDAVLTIRNGEVTGMIVDGQTTWWVQSLRSIDPAEDPAQHIVYRSDHLVAGDWSCGLDELVPGAVHVDGGIAGQSPPPPGCLKKAEIAFDADFEYFQFFDVPGAVDPVADTENDIAAVMNLVDFIYKRDCSITYELVQTIVQTVEPDPYSATDSGELLEQFAEYWRVNHSDIPRHVAHLMTGKDIDSNIIGIAWLPGVCAPDTDDPNAQKPYGLSQSKFTPNMALRVRLTAHELGHNWSAPHCNSGPCGSTCSIMCSSVNGCVQSTHEFEPCSRQFIIDYRDSLSCLTDAGGISFEVAKYVGAGVLAGDRFGTSVAMDGDVAIIGAYTDDGPPNDVGSVYIFRFNPQTLTWNQEAKLVAGDPGLNDRFGNTVDILDGVNGEVAIVGALLDDEGGNDSGAAYIFRNTGAGWTQEQKLLATDHAPFDFFGKSVAITQSGLGEVAIIGAYLDDDGGTSSGSAYIFRNDGIWQQEDKIVALDPAAADQFGLSVDIAVADGQEYAIVGAYQDDLTFTNEGSAYTFQKNGTKWTQTQKLISPHPSIDDQFGIAVGITAKANSQMAAVAAWKADPTGATNAGEMYVYERVNGAWVFQDDVRALDVQAEAHFGNALSMRDNTILVAAYIDDNPTMDAGSAYLFTRAGSEWTQINKFTAVTPMAVEQFGISVGLGTGDQLIIGAWGDDGNGTEAGAAYLTSGSEFVDCNKNQAPDECDIASGTSLDANTDGIPDECQKPASCLGDIEPFPGDGVVDVNDLLKLINTWGPCPAPPSPCIGDISPSGGDGVVDVNDLLTVINHWGMCPK